ncbi:MAG TPA: hypothetical protein PK876_04035 [Elusimicrobiota bacterium]|nr:hypothetical protein [Elusimicrobiota bacterium]
MKNFILFLILAGLSVFWWSDFVSSGRFQIFLDGHPQMKGNATLQYGLAAWHEILSREALALSEYQKIMERYPRSRYAERAQFGVASMLEQLNKNREATEAYQKYIELFPQGPRREIATRRYEILKGQ